MFNRFIYIIANYINLFKSNLKIFIITKNILWGLGIGDWGLGIGDWGLGTIPNPQLYFIF